MAMLLPRIVPEVAALSRRNLVRFVRFPNLLAIVIVQPLLLVFLFRYVFGGAIETPSVAYVQFLMPGIFAMIVVQGSGGHAVAAQSGSRPGWAVPVLTFVSSAFVPSETMPSWLRAPVENSPVSQLVDALRHLTIGVGSAGAVTTTVAWICGLLLVTVPWTVWHYRRLT